MLPRRPERSATLSLIAFDAAPVKDGGPGGQAPPVWRHKPLILNPRSVFRQVESCERARPTVSYYLFIAVLSERVGAERHKNHYTNGAKGK